jgi:hypothetical protein
MLVLVPFLSGTTVYGVTRIYNKITHNFNNKRCRIKIISFGLLFGTSPTQTLRLDCPELRPSGLPVSMYGLGGEGIALMPTSTSSYATVNTTYEWEKDIVGDCMTFDVVTVSQPFMSATPFSPSTTTTFTNGFVTLDITPI